VNSRISSSASRRIILQAADDSVKPEKNAFTLVDGPRVRSAGR
jgi:hypothetical protein